MLPEKCSDKICAAVRDPRFNKRVNNKENAVFGVAEHEKRKRRDCERYADRHKRNKPYFIEAHFLVIDEHGAKHRHKENERYDYRAPANFIITEKQRKNKRENHRSHAYSLMCEIFSRAEYLINREHRQKCAYARHARCSASV